MTILRTTAAALILLSLHSPSTLSDESGPVTAEALEGAWELASYVTADGQPDANGIQLFQDGHFSIAYDMRFGDGEPSARMHAGTYRVDGDRLTFDVQWWVQHVEGEGAILSAVKVSPVFEYDGANLKLEFASGSRQHWRRLETVPD